MIDLPKILHAHLVKQGATPTRVGKWAASASRSGQCARKVAFLTHTPEIAEPMDATVMARLELGNVVHLGAAKLLKAAGIKILGIEVSVSFTVPSHPDRPIPGSIDILAEDEEGELIVEIKSAGAWGWKVAAGLKASLDGEGPVSWEYRAQNLAYQKGRGVKRGVILFWCIEPDLESKRHPTFPFVQVPIEWNDNDWAKIEKHWKLVLSSKPDKLPPRPYEPIPEMVKWKPSGRSVLPFPCNYCGFLRACWPTAQLDPDGPRQKTYVVPNFTPSPVLRDVF